MREQYLKNAQDPDYSPVGVKLRRRSQVTDCTPSKIITGNFHFFYQYEDSKGGNIDEARRGF
jgi:hypothetical protein